MNIQDASTPGKRLTKIRPATSRAETGTSIPLKSTRWQDLDIVELEGFGQPWIVVCKGVLEWDKLDGGTQRGVIRKDTIVGATLKLERPDGPRIRLSRTGNKRYEAMWVLTWFEGQGVLLQELQEPISLDRCFVAEPFRNMYRQVVDVCYQRIWEENLETLWQGNRSLMPTRADIEAKLMRPATTVLFATVQERNESVFAGGAIVHSFYVPCSDSSSAPRENDHLPGLYVDCCASCKGYRAGKGLWAQIIKMPGVLVALHSITLPSTLEFWSKCGMHLVETGNATHEAWLKQSISARTIGQFQVEASAVLASLPSSKLPLYIFVKEARNSDIAAHEDPETAMLRPVAEFPERLSDDPDGAMA